MLRIQLAQLVNSLDENCVHITLDTRICCREKNRHVGCMRDSNLCSSSLKISKLAHDLPEFKAQQLNDQGFLSVVACGSVTWQQLTNFFDLEPLKNFEFRDGST